MKKDANSKRQPSHLVWQVIDLGEDKAKWIRVGAGWANKDGKGVTLKFDAYPVAGRTVVREYDPQEDESEQRR